jgi:IS30 family transposase
VKDCGAMIRGGAGVDGGAPPSSCTYSVDRAQILAESRPRGRPRLSIRPPTLAEPRGSPAFRCVLTRLEDEHWSPQLIAGRMRVEGFEQRVCAETIYRFVYAQAKRGGLHRGLCEHLYTRRKQRRPRGRMAQAAASSRRGPGIELRPAAADSRGECGHWEADLLCFSRPGAVILCLLERRTRLRFAILLPDKRAEGLMRALIRAFDALPSILRGTLTTDNGSEFAAWPLLKAELGMQTYFCAPYCAWQKGSLESLNRMYRRYLPRKTDLQGLDQDELNDICEELNNRPMAVLGYRSPAEALYSDLGLSVALHL